MRSCFHWERSSFCWCGWAAPSAVFWRVSRCWDSKRTSRRSNACCAARASCCLPTIPVPSARRAGLRHLAGVQGLRAAVWCWRQCSHCWKKCVNGSGGWQDERQKIPGVSGRVGVSGRNAFWNGAGFRAGKPARPGIVAALPDPKCTGCSGFCPGPGVGIAEPAAGLTRAASGRYPAQLRRSFAVSAAAHSFVISRWRCSGRYLAGPCGSRWLRGAHLG